METANSEVSIQARKEQKRRKLVQTRKLTRIDVMDMITTEDSLSEDMANVSDFPAEHAQVNTWTDEETEEEDTGEGTYRDEGALPADSDVSVELDGSANWEEECGDGGGGSSGKRSCAAPARMFKLRRNLDQLDGFYQQKEHNVQNAREELKVCRLHIAELVKQRDKLEEDIEREKRAENSAAVFHLRAQHKCLCLELQAEEDLETHVTMALKEHELELCQLEVELGRFLHLRQEVEQEERNFLSKQEVKETSRIRQESHAAKETRIRTLQAKNKQKTTVKEQEARHQRMLEQAQASRHKTALYLKQTLNRMHQKEAEREQQSKEMMKRRMEAVLSLKTSIAATQENLRAQQARDHALALKQREEERQAKESLQAEGWNSTKHMYLQKKQHDFHKKKEEFDDKQRARRVEIVSKLLQEEELSERRRKHQAVLFPPTPAELAKAAGQGKSRERLLQLLHPLTADTTAERPDWHAASRLSCRGSEMSDSSASLDLCDSVETTGREGGEREEERGVKESLAQPEFTGLWGQRHREYTATPDEEAPDKPALSPEKKDPRSQTMDKALSSMTGKKASGKEFKGPPFISKPEVINFKDFEVGKTYKKKIILTNVTYATNYCKLLGVTKNVMDFISISFEPPGPMSAGMACEMEVIFKPVIDEDLEGGVEFRTAAGPFSVPVQCSKKKCEMVVDSSFIDFGTHVAGQTISRAITLTNRGALGSRYVLAPRPSTNPPPLPCLSQPPSPHSQVPPNSSSSEGSVCQDSPVQVDSGKAKSEAESQQPVGDKLKQSGASSVGGQTLVGSEALGPDAASWVPLSDQGREETLQSSHDSPPEASEISIGEVREGELCPFGSVKLQFVFTPTIPGETKLDFHITFSHPSCETIPVTVRGMAVSVPVWVAQPNIDLKICCYDRLYQDSIVVQSRASTALRLTFEVCKELRNHMEILPKTGYLQARSSFQSQLKFLPRCSLPEDAKSFFDQDTGVLEVPLIIQVADQVRPVPFTVHAVVTTSDLEFDRTEVDFGHCSIYNSVKTRVRLTNRSLLPQDFGFLGVPKFMDIQPNDGFGTLLPLETLEIDLIFSPSKAAEYNFQLNCKSGINRDFPLSCRVVGVHPLLELSHSLVQFGATAAGDKSTAILHVANSHTSRNEFTHPVPRVGREPVAPVGPRLFAFAPPENSEITLIPATGRVLPGQRCLVQVTFRPSLSDDVIRAEAVRLVCRNEELRMQDLQRAERETSADKHTNESDPNKREAQPDPKKGKKQPPSRPSGMLAVKERGSKVSLIPKSNSPFKPPNPADIQQGSDEYAAGEASLLRSFKERHSSYIIPCHVSNGDAPDQDQPKESIYSPYNTLYLELHCPAVRPALVVISNGGQTTLDFSQVAVGQKVVKKLTVQNISQDSLELRSSVLDLSGPFVLLNALRPLAPGDTHTLLLAFTPSHGKKYRETLELHSSKMTLEFSLCGVGIVPNVTCSHQGRVVNFGYVLEKESASQVFKLQNTSSLQVKFSAVLDSLSLSRRQHRQQQLPAFLSIHTAAPSTVGTQNYSGLSVFSVTPTEGAIPPGKTQDVTVTFQPDHESRHYSDTLRVELRNKQTVCVLELKGAARAHTMFVCGGDPLDVPTEALVPPLSPGEAESTDSERQPTPLLLTLRSVYSKGAARPAVRELEVGCIRCTQPVAKKNVEFFWENLPALQQKGFSVEPTKGTVDAGSRRTINVTWTPPSGLRPNEVVQVCAPLTLRGDEVEVYSVTLLALAFHNKHSDL